MNVDAKIALVMQVKKIVHKLVYTDQTVYVKGCFIAESVTLIEDLLECANQENDDGVLFAADVVQYRQFVT